MKPVFGDTGYYVALFNPRDSYHRSAVRLRKRFRGRYVTTEFVLIETANFFLTVDARPVYLALVRDLRADPRTTIVPASSGLVARGHDLFAARPDKEWSLTDCTSFVVMGELQLTDALTADRHFAQAGFAPLLV